MNSRPPALLVPIHKAYKYFNKTLERNPLQRSIYEEVAEACKRRGLDSSMERRVAKLRQVNPIIQSGPTCGPVALAMLLDSDAAELVELAKEMHFTKNGEMFSCIDMTELACKAAQRHGKNLRITHCSGNLCSDEIRQKLLDGATLLVPYDSDLNHAPCLRRGHRAHWAAIVGVIMSDDDPSETLVLARHGKSHLTAWGLDELAASNSNLTEFPPHRMTDGLDYVVPLGGIAGHKGLCSQFVMIEIIPQDIK